MQLQYVLHNIPTLWNEELPEGGDDDDDDTGNGAPYPEVRVSYAISDTQIRRIGQDEQDKMLKNTYLEKYTPSYSLCPYLFPSPSTSMYGPITDDCPS